MDKYNYTTLAEEQLEYVEIAAASVLGNGERLFIEVDDQSIVIFNIAGKIFAIGDICTHDGGPLGDGELENYEIICPRHGARFDVRTGKVTMMPAVVDIPAYPARVRNGMIEIGLPK
jgi:3-phenylpropionate/trans-cinnamate dioxygenase ferredoxin subunit